VGAQTTVEALQVLSGIRLSKVRRRVHVISAEWIEILERTAITAGAMFVACGLVGACAWALFHRGRIR
jgi:hypothetical protein